MTLLKGFEACGFSWIDRCIIGRFDCIHFREDLDCGIEKANIAPECSSALSFFGSWVLLLGLLMACGFDSALGHYKDDNVGVRRRRKAVMYIFWET